MQFTRLRLNGFKSFVDPTDLVIADGLTGVVGPNGCGKSNLLEALRWVMGENRPTAMRGSGMEDVIFSGTATRGARNFAEVSVHIDNSARLAPAGFNETDSIDIVRRITRDAGSAYKMNGTDVRARDVSMLFADASTGAHSPALVRQGQISELINAKPKARRRILEEAAGISGLYQRRHEAELKLNAAEANLARVDDVLEQLAAQLKTLERQARQAVRYREIASELRLSEGLLLYMRWRDAGAALGEADAAFQQALTHAAQAETAARRAATEREALDAALPPLREEDAIAAAVLQRALVERETLDAEAARAEDAVATLSARLQQLSRDIDREVALDADASGTVKRLAEERASLVEAGSGHDTALEEARGIADTAAASLQEHEAALAEATEASARLVARHQSAERRVSDAQKAMDRNATDAERANRAAQQAADAMEAVARDHAEAEAALERVTDLAARAEVTLSETEAARAAAQTDESGARAARAEAEGHAGTLEAEVVALTRLLERERTSGDQILDEIRVAAGFEAALGAALSDDLKLGPARATGGTGWTDLPGYPDPPPLPKGAQPISERATGPDLLTRRLSQIGVVAADDGPRLQADLLPGQRLVSPAGDLWRWDGYALAARDAVSTAARRLEQANRLAEVSTEAADARLTADAAHEAHVHAMTRLTELTEADKSARAARRDAEARLAEASRTLSRTDAERTLLASKRESLQEAASRHADEAEAARLALAEAETALAEIPDLDAGRDAVEALRMVVEAARITLMTRRSELDELTRTGTARAARIAAIDVETGSWADRLQTAERRLAELRQRHDESEAALQDAKAKPATLVAQRERLSAAIAEAEARKAASADALSKADSALKAGVSAEREAERDASRAREARAVAEARCDGAREAVAAAEARIAEELECSVEGLRDQLDPLPDPLPASDRVEADVTRLRRQRDALGAVNLRAEEDARTVEAEHDGLAQEKADLEGAIAKLRSGIAALNKEGRGRLLKAFDEVNANFAKLFTHLFAGGEARLVLVESDDPLEAGLEILCQPPGKKLSTLSLLSGGEQTLTALALIFAVFLANPAPICVLDEVDAPLDDANVTRFCDLLDEMTRQTDTRFLIITHHAVTMARMDRLFGVTMGEQGVSQLVSVDLNKAEQMVA